MKNLTITWDETDDPTGYLFSFAKALSVAVNHSPYSKYTEDIITTSGFAFRMWVAADLCPSAMSIWEFKKQKQWVENGGLLCDYKERLWKQESVEEERLNQAIEIIRKSINSEIPAISWDIGVPEWGLITGYDDTKHLLSTLSVSGKNDEMPYETLGKREIPILSVLTITGENNKKQEDILIDTLKLASGHLSGKEWCDNAKGLEAYPALIAHFDEKFKEPSWEMEYYLGTYAALKYYAHKFFDKYNVVKFTSLYKQVAENWLEAFKIKTDYNLIEPIYREKIVKLLNNAFTCERKVLELIENTIN